MMDILLNSGAFSAWKLGERIDLDKYVGFAKVNQRHIYRPINLDVIPGSFGSREWRPMSIEAAAANLTRTSKGRKKPGSTRFRFSTRMKTSAGWKNILRTAKTTLAFQHP